MPRLKFAGQRMARVEVRWDVVDPTFIVARRIRRAGFEDDFDAVRYRTGSRRENESAALSCAL